MEPRTIRMLSGALGRPVAVAALAGVLALGALAGCSSEGSPPVTSPSASAGSASPSPSVSASPSPAASPSVEIPAAARVKSDKGAEAFVRFFFDQVNASWTAPKVGLVESLSDEGCQFCSKTEADAQGLVRANERYGANPITLKALAVLPGAAPKGQSFVRTDALQNRVDILSDSNVVLRSDAQKDLKLVTGLIWKGGRWFVYEVEAR